MSHTDARYRSEEIAPFGKYSYNVWAMYIHCFGDYLNSILTLFGKYLENIRIMFGQHLANVWTIFERHFYNICKLYKHWTVF